MINIKTTSPRPRPVRFFINALFGKKITSQFDRALYGEAMLVPFLGAPMTETSVIEFCYWNEKLLL